LSWWVRNEEETRGGRYVFVVLRRVMKKMVL